MLEKLSQTQRLVIAAVLAFVFFAFYESYIIQPSMPQQSTKQVAEQKNEAPAVKTESTSSPSGSITASTQTGSVADATIATIKTAITTIEIDDLGRVKQVTLSGKIFEDEEHRQLKLYNSNHTRALELRFADKRLNDLAFQVPYAASVSEIDATTSEQQLTLTQNLDGVVVTKTITVKPDGSYRIGVDLSSYQEYFITTGYRPDLSSDPMTVQGALVHTASGTVEAIEEGDAKGTESFRGAKMASAFDRYYASLLYNYEAPFDVYINREKGVENAPLVFIRGSQNLELGGYIGPKYVKELRKIHPELTAAVEYGFFTFISKPLFSVLEWIHNAVPNWGWAIVIFTILVKIVLFPLSHRGMVSMSKLKDIAPKMKELQEKYKDDKQKLQIHMMELYKKHGANPLGGCLPLLLQIPIFFAIYRVLLNAIELKGADWLYLTDLSAKDPFFVLPLLMGATMYLQQRITPSNFTDPMQEKLFKWLPVIFTVFFLFFPAGLVLYWLVNNILSIGQQWLVNKQMEKRRELEIKEARNEKN